MKKGNLNTTNTQENTSSSYINELSSVDLTNTTNTTNTRQLRTNLSKNVMDLIPDVQYNVSQKQIEDKDFETKFLLKRIYKASKSEDLIRILSYVGDFEFTCNVPENPKNIDKKKYQGISNIGGVIRYIYGDKYINNVDLSFLLKDVDLFYSLFDHIFNMYRSNSEAFKKKLFDIELNYSYIPLRQKKKKSKGR